MSYTRNDGPTLTGSLDAQALDVLYIQASNAHFAALDDVYDDERCDDDCEAYSLTVRIEATMYMVKITEATTLPGTLAPFFHAMANLEKQLRERDAIGAIVDAR